MNMEKPKIKKESLAKQDSSLEKNSNNKKTTDKVKIEDQNLNKYAVISPESVLLIAESAGITDISNEAITGLSEEVSYRIREVIHNCSILVHNTKRRKLNTEDVNRVLEVSNTPKVYGHSVPHSLDFTFVPKAELFVENDLEIDIVAMASMSTSFTKPGQEYVKGCWLLPDPAELSQKVKEEPSTSGNSTHVPPPQKLVPRSEAQLKNYYLQVARVILGCSEPHLRVALADLRSNPKIGPIVPYFLNLLPLSWNKLQRHGQLTDSLLRTVEALVNNPYIDPSSQLAVNRAVNTLLLVAIEPTILEKCDDLLLRNRAGQLLAWVLQCWSIELKQQMDIVSQLLKVLLSEVSAYVTLRSHYGAVATLTALGQKILFSFFWPVIDRYVPILERQEHSPTNVQYIKGAIVVAYERMHKRKMNLVLPEDYKRWLRVEQELYELLGDSLVPRYHLRPAGQGSIYPLATVLNSERPQPFSDIDLQLRESLIKACSPHTRFTLQPEARMRKLHMYSVFSLSHYAIKQSREIQFSFSGSKQMPVSQLKRRKIGESIQMELKNHHFKFAQIWRHQTFKKKTRNVKICTQSHIKSSAGDLFTFI